ncbi:hypothetical protein ACVC7V_21365 [Hydrogenophaga sp. A37]|uniref:hypothetical protein n=1 Tax=Hydrogenophaga sp. A37 TaxID=1945864 RepID=UPI000985538C|nr:hypothetical protein [Hydrogenophaga sp. A37]OOG81536.1 hypothetical protein B0E41_17395 [Hydrogenophaga sp. A37]
MGRTANESQAQTAEPAAAGGALEVLEASTRELATLQADQASKAIVVARQIGYEGSLSVGAIEDEIRFYQRRTVEAILETGKRLLVLKELTPHGEFTKRVELLGLSDRTAQRFMQAAAKTAKSANLAVLASQVKSGSVFLELVTHDDDVLDGLQEMDDFDRMSASQLREAARGLQADKAATEQLLTAKNKKIDELARKSKRFNVHVDLPEEFVAADALAGGLKRDALAKLKALREIREQAMGERPADEEGQKVHDSALGALAVTMRDALLAIEEELARSMQDFTDTLSLFLPE